MFRYLILALALVAATAAPASARQLVVDELVHHVRPVEGAAEITIAVHNEALLPADVVVELGEWEVDATGAHRFHPLGTLSDSCAGRLALARETFSIAAGGTDTVHLTYDGGPHDRCRVIVWLRTDDDELPLDDEGVRLVIRTGVKLHIAP